MNPKLREEILARWHGNPPESRLIDLPEAQAIFAYIAELEAQLAEARAEVEALIHQL